MHVLLITEGTYPYHWGGVSTWCHMLLQTLSRVDFTVFSIVASPRVKPLYQLPSNVVNFRTIPLWGIREALEMHPSIATWEVLRRHYRTGDKAVAEGLLPAFDAFLADLFTEEGQAGGLGRLVHGMYRFFQEHDFDRAVRSQLVWNCFVSAAQQHYPGLAARYGYRDTGFTLSDLTKGMQWLCHSLFPIAAPVPQVDIAHAAMAGVCTLVAVCAKLEHNAAFLLSEHGIYLRECYLAEAPAAGSLFLKLLRLRFARRMTELSYDLADQVSPCCDYNQRWETRLGADPRRLKTIHYGVDPSLFKPMGQRAKGSPVVVWVGRINPLKGLETLVQAAALVRDARPDIQFHLFGGAAPEDQPYYQEILDLCRDLGLEDVLRFRGYISEPQMAFNQADLVVLSSISEGFPFSLLEAMLCAKPIVATDVGGVAEEIEGCGVVVEPRNPQAMAQAILQLVNDPGRRLALGRFARLKASREYGISRSSHEHYETYRHLALAHPGPLSVGVATPVALLDRAGMAKRYIGCEGVRGGGRARGHRRAYGGTHGPAFSLSERVASTPAARVESRAKLPVIAGGGTIGGPPDAGSLLGSAVTALARRMFPPSSASDIFAARGPMVGTAEEAESKLAGLAVELARRIPLPVDWLEATAVLESMGITDAVAARQFGAADTFSLAQSVLGRVRRLHRIGG